MKALRSDLRRKIRRNRHVLTATVVTIYATSGLLLLAGVDTPQIHGVCHLMLGVAHLFV
jgi:hypothetical protein